MRIVDLEIQDIAFGGKGVGRDQGKAVFVPYVIDGEEVSATIVREKKNFAEAELAEIRTESPDRVKPRCPYFGECGGCSYQHINYEHQLAIKHRQVKHALERIAGFRDVPVLPILPSPEQYNYRNRITVHVQDGVIGFFRRDSHRLLDIECCPISHDEVNRALTDLRKANPPDGHYTLRTHDGSRVFLQTNDAVAAELVGLVDRYIPAGQDLLIDAYCGAGLFARALRNKFGRVVGIDWDRFAIAAAQKGAAANERYIAGDVAIELASASSSSPSASITLIVDPPSTGLAAAVREAIRAMKPARLIYISCNPPTLARDLKELSAAYSVNAIVPLDMFPQTAEIEVAAFLQG